MFMFVYYCSLGGVSLYVHLPYVFDGKLTGLLVWQAQDFIYDLRSCRLPDAHNFGP